MERERHDGFVELLDRHPVIPGQVGDQLHRRQAWVVPDRELRIDNQHERVRPEWLVVHGCSRPTFALLSWTLNDIVSVSSVISVLDVPVVIVFASIVPTCHVSSVLTDTGSPS